MPQRQLESKQERWVDECFGFQIVQRSGLKVESIAGELCRPSR